MASFDGMELLAVFGEKEHMGPLFRVEHVTTDSRHVDPDSLYIALKGERFDGHDFLDQAIEKGATTVIIDRKNKWTNENVSVFRVESPLSALGELATYHRQKFSIPMIGITGSVGKTSTKDLVAAALGTKHEVMKTQGNFNNEIGVPLTLLSLNHSHRYGVVEMGMRGLGEIAYLTSLVRPTVAIVMNVEEVHIGRLGTIEKIAQAKSELISDMTSPASVSVLNWDDPYVRKMATLSHGKVLSFGTSSDADIRGRVVVQNQKGLTIEYQWLGEEKEELVVPLYGRHQLSNLLAAIGVARLLGKTAAEVAENLKRVGYTPMRLEPLCVKGVFVLNDAYNANVRAMKSALDTFKEIGPGEKTIVLGDMFELGEYSEESHKEVLQYGLDLGFQRIFVLGEAMKKAANLLGADEILYLEDAEQAARRLEETLAPGDSLLLKGSRGMALEKVLDYWKEI